MWCSVHLTANSASRNNGVQLLISRLASCRLSRRLRASRPFDLPETQIIGKAQWIATCQPLRAPASFFFSLCLFCYFLSSSLLLSDPSHICFSICPYGRKFSFQTILNRWFLLLPCADAIWLPCFSSLPVSSSALPQHPSGRKNRKRMKHVDIRTSISTDPTWVPHGRPVFSLAAFKLRLCCSPGSPKNRWKKRCGKPLER